MDIYEALYTTNAARRRKPNPIPYSVQALSLDAGTRTPNITQQGSVTTTGYEEDWLLILVA